MLAIAANRHYGACVFMCDQLHAQYNEVDEYEAHRAVQGLQLSQFIQHTSDGCDLVILGGDFNFRPDQLGYRLIRYGGNLDDAWTSRVRDSTSAVILCQLSKVCVEISNPNTWEVTVKCDTNFRKFGPFQSMVARMLLSADELILCQADWWLLKGKGKGRTLI